MLAAVVLGLTVYQAVSSEQALSREYATAVAAADREDWDQAVSGFQTVVNMRADYKDAASRLDSAKQEQRRSQ